VTDPRTFRAALALAGATISCSNGTIGGAAPANRSSDASATHRDAGGHSGPHSDAGHGASHDAGRVSHDAGKPPKGDAGHPTTNTSDATAGTDAGRPLGTDRSTFFGASRCAAAHVQLCEDFEGASLDTSIWEVTGSPAIDTAQKARGAQSLHVRITGNGAQFIRERKTFPMKDDTYWGRAFVYFEQLPQAPMTYAHWTFIAASGSGVSGEIRLSGQLSNGKNLFGVGTDNRTDPDGTGDWTMSDKDPNGVPSLHTWSCIEWLHSGGTNETRFFLDGVEHPSLHTTETVNGGNGMPYKLPQFDNVWVGWQEYQSSTETFELWVDEFAIDGSRIGCEI
jgi:hypothetical protein